MDICKQTKWLCENTRRLERFAGSWVAFSPEKNRVHAGPFKQVMRFCHGKRTQIPFLFHVPSKTDLRTPLPIGEKK